MPASRRQTAVGNPASLRQAIEKKELVSLLASLFQPPLQILITTFFFAGLPQADRMALCSYALTGQLLGGHVGSVAMFVVPPGGAEKAMEENFLQVCMGAWSPAKCTHAQAPRQSMVLASC